MSGSKMKASLKLFQTNDMLNIALSQSIRSKNVDQFSFSELLKTKYDIARATFLSESEPLHIRIPRDYGTFLEPVQPFCHCDMNGPATILTRDGVQNICHIFATFGKGEVGNPAFYDSLIMSPVGHLIYFASFNYLYTTEILNKFPEIKECTQSFIKSAFIPPLINHRKYIDAVLHLTAPAGCDESGGEGKINWLLISHSIWIITCAVNIALVR
jgi:hypothetical protein